MDENAKKTTILFLVKYDENSKPSQICLGLKKRGHGEGNWNGAGGKLEQGEAFEDAAMRELDEEFGVKALNLKLVANLYFPPDGEDSPYFSKVYLCDSWSGDLSESEEMRPTWFDISEIPYEKMWESDRLWLPLVLKGNCFDATYFYHDRKIQEELAKISFWE